MVYILLIIFGSGLLVNSFLLISVIKKQQEIQSVLSRMRRKKAKPMPSSEKRGER